MKAGGGAYSHRRIPFSVVKLLLICRKCEFDAQERPVCDVVED